MNPTIKLGEKYGFNITPSSPKKKNPIVKDWQNTKIHPDKIKEYEKSGHNLGYVCGPTTKNTWLVVIDFDNKKAFDKIINTMPKTLVINTGKKDDWRGKQVYYLCDESVENQDLDFEDKEILSIRGKGRFVVGPGSTHPTGVKYEIAADNPIAKVNSAFFNVVYDQAESLFEFNGDSKEKQELETINPKNISPLYTLTYKDIFPDIDDSGINIPHPVHDSTTGHNFKIDEKNLGHCFHHHVSLAAWQMLSIKAGICSCKEAGNGFKGKSKSVLVDNDVLLNKLWEYAIEEKLVFDTDKLPSKIKHLHQPSIDEIIVHEKDEKGKVKKTKIYPGVLGDYISYEYRFATLTDTEEVFVYSGGVYVPGETLIKHDCQKVLGSKLIKTHYVKEATDFIRRKTYEDRESFDLDDKLINLKNGMYDTENNKLISHTPDYLSFIQLPIEYDLQAKCPLWDSYLGNTLPLDEDRMILQEVAGWVFMGGYYIQKAVLLEGGGGNGKSVYLDTITEMIGSDNVSNISFQDLGGDKYAKAQLYGKLANINSDLPKDAISDTSSFKALTGGDKIWSDVKHSIKGINFYNRAKLIYAANQIPRTKDITNAFFDRIILVTFPHTIRGTEYEDKHLKKKLKRELSGIFNWAIVGFNRLSETEEFSTSKTSEDFKSIYLKKSDSVFAFFRDMVRKGSKSNKITKEDVYQEYVGYCKSYLNAEPIAKETFGKAFGKQAGWIGSGQRYFDIEGNDNPTRISAWTSIIIKKMPGKQGKLEYKPKSRVHESHTLAENVSEPEKRVKSRDARVKTVLPTQKTSSSLGNTKKDEKGEAENIISTKNEEKPLVSLDIVPQKDRLTLLRDLIIKIEKEYNAPVFKTELLDEYETRKLTKNHLQSDINRLMQDGIIYDPNRNERYKVV